MMKHESLSFKEVIIEKCNEYKIPHDFLSQAVGGHHDLDDLKRFYLKFKQGIPSGCWRIKKPINIASPAICHSLT